MKKFLKENNSEKGFSLIGIIFSIFIISVGLVTILNLFSRLLYSELKNEKRLIAVYLAEESIEAVRQQRDNNWFGGDNWDDNFDNIQSTGEDGITGLKNEDNIGAGWEIKKVVGVGNQWKKKVYINIANNYYAQSNSVLGGANWQDSGFKRWINLNKIDYDGNADNDYMKVTATVSYKGEALAEITSYLNNWK